MSLAGLIDSNFCAGSLIAAMGLTKTIEMERKWICIANVDAEDRADGIRNATTNLLRTSNICCPGLYKL